MYPRNNNSPFIQPIAKNQGGLKDMLTLYTNSNNSDSNINNTTSSNSSSTMTTPVKGTSSTPMVFTPIKENQPIAFNLNAAIATPNKSDRTPLTPVKVLNSPTNSSSSSGSSDENDEDHPRVFSRSPMSSPNFKSPKNKTLKQKRIRNLTNQLPTIKSMDDVVKLQEEITENRDKIQSLQQQLSSAQKEKGDIENEKKELMEKLKQLDEKREMAEQRENNTKVELEELEKKLTTTVETLHQEFDKKISVINNEHTQTEKYSQHTISVLRDQLCQLHSQNESTKKMLEKLEKDNVVQTKKLESDQQLIVQLQKDIETTTNTNAEISQSLETTKESYTNVKKDLFFSTCLAIKLNQLMLNTPVNICTQDLWEEAESQQITSSRFTQFISQKVKMMQQQTPPSPSRSPRKQSPKKNTTTIKSKK